MNHLHQNHLGSLFRCRFPNPPPLNGDLWGYSQEISIFNNYPLLLFVSSSLRITALIIYVPLNTPLSLVDAFHFPILNILKYIVILCYMVIITSTDNTCIMRSGLSFLLSELMLKSFHSWNIFYQPGATGFKIILSVVIQSNFIRLCLVLGAF